MIPSPDRRCLRFSIRTLLVAAAVLCCFAAWLGYYGRWHNQREALLRELPPKKRAYTNQAEFPLSIFEESHYELLVLPAMTAEADLERYLLLFPEAQIERAR